MSRQNFGFGHGVECLSWERTETRVSAGVNLSDRQAGRQADEKLTLLLEMT